LGEPLNVVISALSDALILTDAGLTDFMWSINYSEEFLGQSLGERQAANLGDGNGQCELWRGAPTCRPKGEGAKLTQIPFFFTVNQTDILRYNFGDPIYGTLQESINGGSHVRYWKQNGFVGAFFLLP
jgi:hypothetical protein